MNLKMVRLKNETQDLLLLITKICQKLSEQTHRKAEETLEYKMNKPSETFHFEPPVPIKGKWMIGLRDLEVYNSNFNITEENNKFELYIFPDEKIGGVSYTKVRDEIEKDLGISDTTPPGLQDDIIAPNVFQEYRERVTKIMKADKYVYFIWLYYFHFSKF